MSSVVMREVAKGEDGLRLDRWFKANYPALSHGALEKMLRKGQVRVDGGRVKANTRVEAGQVVRVPPMPEAAVEASPKPKAPVSQKTRKEDAEALRQMKIYEDEAILVLNKPYGLAVQGGSKTNRHIDGMLAALEKDGERPRLVHRLDRDTSGVLVVAKTRLAAAALGKAFAGHDVEKTYWALVAGSPRPKEGTIRIPIAKRPVKGGKDAGQEKVVAADDGDAQKATTDFMTVDAAGPVTFLAMKPLTGRTHQLRVHAAAMETPIVGDFKYGGPAARVEGVEEKLHLFCRSMRFPHPTTGRMITVTAPLEGHMRKTWKFFSFDAEAKVVWPDIKSKIRKRK